MSGIRVSLFGKLRIERVGGPDPEIDSQKAQELLCYLLLHRDRRHSRELLAGTLWADLPPARARQYLRKAVWQVQSAFGNHESPSTATPLHVQQETVAVNTDSGVWVDACCFDEAMAAADD